MQEGESSTNTELEVSSRSACASRRRAAAVRVGENLLVGCERITRLKNTPEKGAW